MSTNFTDSKFDALSGLETAKTYIRRMANQVDVARAVLLYGPEGAGKGTLGRILAQSWLCKTPVEGLACGECPSCIAYSNELNADVFELEPTGAGDQIRVGAISDGRGDAKKDPFSIQKFLRTLPLQSRSKVVLLEDCHRMNAQAQNAILKALEEPEPYARFILTTTRLVAISPTIRSRCATISCGAPDQLGEDGLRLTPGVRARFDAKDGYLDTICQIASDSVRNPISALRNAEKFRELILEAKDDDESSTRSPQLEALAILAEAFRKDSEFDAATLTIEAHGRVRANGQFPLVTDALFARIATQS